MSQLNVDPQEIAKFEAFAAIWWDQHSEFRPLHQINPLRLNWIDEHSGGLAGKKVLDVGCGGGILSESMARRGADVLGIDMGEAPLNVARLHAQQEGVENIEYRQIPVEQLAEETMLSERSITRYRTEERFDYSIDTVAVLCIGMRLDPLLSLDLIRKAGIMLRNTPEDLMINAVLMGMHRFSVLEVAKYLKMSQYPRIKNWPEAE